MLKILNKNVLAPAGRFTLVEENYENENGLKIKHITLEHPGAVVILPVFEQKIVFVRQYRHSVKNFVLELPAGALEKGEDALLAAKREIQEEIGYAARDWQKLGELYPTPGFCNEVQHVFLANNLFEQRLEADEDEKIVVESVPLEDIDKILLKEGIIDGKSLAAIYLAKIKKLI